MQLPNVDDFVPLLLSALALLLPALALIFTWLHHARATSGKLPALRPLAGIEALSRRIDEVVESGRPVHIATGGSQPGTIGPTAESIASLLVTQRLAEAVTSRGGSLIITDGDVVTHTAVRGVVRQAYRRTGFAADYSGTAAQLVAHQTPIAYAAGVTRRYATEPVDASAVVGNFGAEALLIGEEGAQRRLPQLSGATTLGALPGLVLSTDATLIGEELFAAEAYLTDAEAPKARLLTQDALRWALVVLIVAGIVYQTANIVLNLGLPSL